MISSCISQVAQMRSKIFKVGTLSSSLTNIMSEGICVDYNIEGMHGKKKLRCYTNFLNALLGKENSIFIFSILIRVLIFSRCNQTV